MSERKPRFFDTLLRSLARREEKSSPLLKTVWPDEEITRTATIEQASLLAAPSPSQQLH